MEGKTFERELPRGYKVGAVLDASRGKFAVVLTILSLIPLVVAIALLALPFILVQRSVDIGEELGIYGILDYFLGMLLTVGYIVLHELVHGAVYKKHTGEKLTYGFTFTCAYCGVPRIFTYRRTALAAVLAPFLLFSLILIPVLAVCYFVSTGLYVAFGVVFVMHLSGCSGDLFVALLFAFKYKDDRVLMNDNGPRLAFFVPTDDETRDPATETFLAMKKAEEI